MEDLIKFLLFQFSLASLYFQQCIMKRNKEKPHIGQQMAWLHVGQLVWTRYNQVWKRMKGKDLDSDNVKAELVTVDCKNNSSYGLSFLIDEFVKKILFNSAIKMKPFIKSSYTQNIEFSSTHHISLEQAKLIIIMNKKKCSSNKHLNQLLPNSMNKT